MYLARSSLDGAMSEFDYIEMDPTGRYGRLGGILGKGATKTVYKAFDEVLGMEVAWNQVILNEVFRTPEEVQRLYSEVHLLKSLDHHSILEIYSSWVDVDRRTFNFITEMFTSGTLREYRQKFKRIDIRAIKTWARQILEGLCYMHSHNPRVIHGDLKCDNIFVNGHLGQVKIGDLGLAATLSGSQRCHSVIGTPEFMAPEIYDEDYDELVDIYSFGMCMLEMLTSEYPFNECSNKAQIYKKVYMGKLPAAFYRIDDPQAREFVGKCLESASKRPSANQLLLDPFLHATTQNQPPNEIVMLENELIPVEPKKNTDMIIRGTINPENDTIFLELQFSDQHGKGRNIDFSFDIEHDTAVDVAIEMVKEFEIYDLDPLQIADLIDGELSALVPTWKQCDQLLTIQQDTFDYQIEDNNEKEDENIDHPFYYLSSDSSSQTSLPPISLGPDWYQEDNYIIDEDTCSEGSSNSYSNVRYCSSNDTDSYLSSKTGKIDSSTRLSSQENMANTSYLHNIQGPSSSNHKHQHNQNCHKMRRNGSLVDIRSRLLNRSLATEINKSRLFKTVGAVESIGYQETNMFSRNKGRMGGGSSGKTPKSGHKLGFMW